MQLLGYVQIYGFLILYALFFVGVPALIFGGKLKNFRLCVRFPMYLCISHTYVITLVLFLEICHLAYRSVIWAITVGLILIGLVKVRKFHPIELIKYIYYRFQVIAAGAVGTKTFILHMVRGIGAFFKSIFEWIKRYLLKNPVATITLIAIAVMLIVFYGEDYSTIYGWRASDCPVHAFWINGLIEGKPFVAGIYPFGYHCVVYFFWALFGIPVYIGMRAIGFVTVVFLCLILFAALRYVCKSEAAPAIGILLYFMWSIINKNGIIRFRCGLPQEYGMLFIAPCMIFLCEFCKRQSEKPKEKGMIKKWDDSKLMVAFMGISCGLTFAVHFYNTIVAILAMVGVAVGGYLFRVLRPRYLVPIIISGFLGIFIFILPMGICFATGTPLQGSLGWALEVMGVKEKKAPVENTNQGNGDGELLQDENGNLIDENGNLIDENGNLIDENGNLLDENGNPINPDEALPKEKVAPTSSNLPVIEQNDTALVGKIDTAVVEKKVYSYLPDGVSAWLQKAKNKVTYVMCYNKEIPSRDFTYLVTIVFLLPFFLGLILRLQNKEWGLAVMGFGVGGLFVYIEYLLAVTGIMHIMDESRSLNFILPMFFMNFSLCVDGLVSVVFGWFKKKWLLSITSLMALLAIGYSVYAHDAYRTGPLSDSALQTNGSISCVTNILATNDNMTWTIVSAGDELRMIEEYGWHTEMITFLRSINKVNAYSKFTIPTEKIYFFIEKEPTGSGETVSETIAAERVPNVGGINVYQGHNRAVCMSKMYYWALAFSKCYPNEMYVYYEDDEFICYCLEQDPYSVLNLAIDYGFNSSLGTSPSEIMLGEDGVWTEKDERHIFKEKLDLLGN